ncbi:hypothetical protein ACJJTC_014197 [Scirpophaga incertulas]
MINSELIKNPLVRQYLIVIAVNLNVLGIGVAIAWPSSMLVKLRDETDTVLDRPITEEEGSWIVSAGFLVGSVLIFIPAFTLDQLGRKYSILIFSLLNVIGFLFLTISSQLWHLVFGRILVGVSALFNFTVVPTYTSEIASTEVRGSLGTILQIMCALGFVIMMSVGPFVSYLRTNIFCLSLISVALIPALFLPESPYFLYRKGRITESMKVLTYLRGSEMEAKDELKEYDIADMDKVVNRWELFKNLTFLKSLGIIFVIGIATHFIGLNVVTFYLQTIFKMTQTSVAPEISSVIIGIIEVTAAICTATISDRFGRKPIFGTALIGMSIGMDAETVNGFLNFLPIICLVVVDFSFSAGPGSLNWALTSELFESKARGTGLAIAMVISGVSLFVTAKYFAVVMESIGPAAIFWIFSGNCFLFCLFIVFVIPETKGKSFTEIQIALGGKKMADVELASKSVVT